MSDRLKTLYGQLVRNGYDLGGYEKFNAAMHDSNRRRSLYNQLVANRADLGGYEKFSSVVENTPPTTPSAPQKKRDVVADTINMLRTPSSQYTRPQPSKSVGTFEMPSKYDVYHDMPDAVKRHQTPTPLKPEAVMPSVPSNAAESVWAAADKAAGAEVRKKVDEGWSWRKIMQALSSGASVTGGLGDDNAQALETTSVAHLKTHDLQKLSDQAWAALGSKQQQSIINDSYIYLKEQYPDADDKALVDAARKMARAKSDEQMYNLAVEKNMPKSVGEFFLRKAAAASSFGSLSKGYASMMAGTRGDMEAEDTALQKYGAKHKVADIAGSVAGFAVDPLTYASGAVGGATTKVALWAGGKVLSEAAARKMSQTLGGKLLLGAVSGAANFGTFETGGEALNQYKWGGTLDVDPETGRYVVGDFSLGKVASQMRHGLTMGGLTGAFGTWLGNVSTKAAQATTSTLGKLGVRAGELGVGLVGEGTIFATPEFISTYGDYNDVIKSVSDKNSPNYIADDKERSKYIAELKAQRGERMMDIWQDNLAMIAGFKAQHAIKSAGRTISELAASRRGKVGFVERMGRMLDGHPSLALSKEEQAELDKHGYGDLTQMVKEYKAYAQKDGDLPYNKITQLLNDKNVSEAARAKMYYYVTGHSLPMSAVIASNVIDNGDKTYTVQSLGDNGVITSRTYGSRKRADYEKARIDRQAELNGVAMAEQMFDNMDKAERLKAVCTRLAQDKGVSPETLLWLTRKDPKQMTAAEKRWLKEIEDAANEDAPQGENATVRHIKGVIIDEYGVDVDKALRKAADSRTEAEETAISAYNNELAQAVAERKNAISQDETTDAYRRGYEADTQGMRDAYVAQMYEPSEDNAETLRGVESQITESAKYQAALERDELKQMTHKDGSIHLATLKDKDKDGNGKQVYIVDGDIVMKEDGSGIDADASSKSVIIYDPATGEKKMVSPTAVDGIESLGEVKTAEQREAEINAHMQDTIQRGKDWLEGNVANPVGMQIQLGDGRIATIEAMHEDGKSAIATLPDGTQFLVPNDVLQRIVNNGQYADYKARRDAEAGKREAEQDTESAPETATEGGQPLPEESSPKEEESREYAQGDVFDVVVDGNKMHAEIVSPKDADGRFVVNVDDGESMRTLYVTPEELAAMEYREEPSAKAEETRLATEGSSEKALERGEQPTEEHTPTALERIPRDEKGNAQFHDVDTETAWDGLVEMSGNEETAHKVAEASLANAERKLKAAKALKEKGETPEELLRSIKENEAAAAEAQRVVDAWKAIVGEESRREEAAKAEAERIATEKAEAERKAAEERERAEAEEKTRIEAEKKEAERIAAEKAEEEARVEAERKAEEERKTEEEERKERDENGQPFVVSSDGTTTFGEITEDTGLTAAPIKLSEGFQDANTGKGYGLVHIEANHGEQIRQAGFTSVKEFVSFVATHYDPDNIRVGKRRDDGSDTFLIQVTDTHDNTLFIELSKDGSYWNVNSGGIFRKGYSNKKETVAKTEPQQPTNAVSSDSSLSANVKDGITNAEPNGEPTVSLDKGTTLPADQQTSEKENTKKVADSEGENTLKAKIEAASADVNTEPTEAQKKAGNYKKGHVQVGTFDITIEQPEGSIRRGTDADGKKWESKMHNTYGYFRGTEGVDGDHIDVFLSNDIDGWNGRKVFVVDQYNPDGTFDEHKVMLGFNDMDEAKSDYLANYEKGWENGRRITVSTTNLEDFEKWIDSSHRKTKPFSEYSSVNKGSEKAENKQEKESVFDKAKEIADKEEKKRKAEADKPKQKPLTEAERKDAEEVAGALGYRVEWVDTMEENGTIDADKKVIRIAKDAENPLVQVLGHEVAHGVRRMIGGKFRALQKAAMEVVGEKEWNERIEKKRKLNAYAEGKLAEEVTCDIVGEALNNKDALKRLAESLRGEKGILARLRDAVARMVEYFKNRGDKEGVRRMKAADKLLAEFESALKEGVASGQANTEGVDRSVRESEDEPENKRRKDFAERFGVDESYVSDYANGMAQKNTGKAAIARRSMERQIYLANDGKTSKLSDIAKSLKSFRAALKEAFGDLDALIDEYRKLFEEERNMMEAARKKAEEEAAARKRHLDELSLLTDGQIDSRYAEALEKGDETEAREMLDEVARRKGYGDENNEYRMQHRAPSNPGYESDEARRNDIENGPDVNLEDIALGYNRQPDDYFTNPRGYGNDTPHGRESTDAVANALSSIRQGGRDVTVKVYRAVPTTMKEGKLRNGDWVTLSRRYAEMHGNHTLNGKYRIMEDEVPAKDIWWDGNDVNEFGYDNGEDYKYKNVKNNRKSDDLVTRDDKGNVIPPSKRFNQRKADERYSRRESKALTAEERELRDNLVERMRKGGLDVVTDSEEMQRVIDTENERTRNMFVGEKGATEADKAEEVSTRLDNLSVARRMEEAGKDAKAIKMATGWERGTDGKWRYETSDIKLKPFEEWMNKKNLKLGDIIDSDSGLFEMYPKLKDFKVTRGKGKSTNAAIYTGLGKIEINFSKFKPYMSIPSNREKIDGILHRVINHEIQHAIQDSEGFAQGVSPNAFRPDAPIGKLREMEAADGRMVERYNAMSYTEKALGEGVRLKERILENRKEYNALASKYRFGMDGYTRAAGEVEARNTEKRIGMTEEERKASLASETEDVAREDQILLGVDNADGEQRFLRTADGEVYGLVKDGRIYLDPKVATAETAVHEYTHLWGDMLRRKDSEQWSHTVKELKNSVLWEEVKESYPELKTDDEIADEVLSTFSGRRGAERLREEARRVADGDGGVFTKAKAIEALEKVKEAIARFWEGVAKMFGINRYRSAEELADMAMKDLLDSKNPMKDESGMRKRGEVGETLATSGTYFSGGGLLEAGLKGVIDPKVAVEFSEKIAGVYADNHGNHIVVADVRDVDPKKLVGAVDGGEVQYFHASPVCKNFSKAKREGGEVELDKETALSTAEFIAKTRPKVVTIENVKGYRNSEALKIITDELTRQGYDWDADVYNAADYGGYTKRERLIVRAKRDGKLPPKPEKLPEELRKKGWYSAVEDLIPHLEEKKTGVPQGTDERLKNSGIDYRTIDKPLYVFGRGYANKTVGHAFADELLPTLTTGGGDIIIMPDGRVLKASPRVLARVTGLPDTYKMPETDQLSHTIVGNGIPTQLTEGVIAPLLDNAIPSAERSTKRESVFDVADRVSQNLEERTRAMAVKKANDRFNEELEKQVKGELEEGHVYKLGMPSEILLSTGVPNLPIQMSAQRLEDKATKFGHNFDIAEVKDLVNAIQKPIAIFEYGDRNKSQNLIVEIQKDGKNFIIGLSLNPVVKGKALEINSVRNVFPKDNAEWLNWISQNKLFDGKISEVDKKGSDSIDRSVRENPKNEDKPRYSRKPGESIFDYASRVSEDVDRSVRERVSARDEYEKKVKSKGFQTKEALQNSMLGLQEFMSAIDHASGNKRYIEDIPDFENPILGENRLSSVNKEEMHQVAKTQFKPLMSAVAKLSGNGKESGELYDYMFAKHGLERDAVMRQREAQKEFDKYQKANPKGTKTIGDFVASLEGKDYAGLTALTAEDGRVKSIQSQIDAIDEQMKATDDQLLLRKLGGQKKRLKVDLLNAARDAADDIRKAFESDPNHNLSDINELWKRVNEVNGNTLRKLYESGMLTKEAYNDISSMYTNYIPMRGFDQTTSADAYAYLTHGDSAFNAPIKTAKGRSSKADNPIAYMQAMAESAIMQGNRNVLVKQKMLNFVRNHPSDLASVSDVWLQYDSVADEWKPVFPDNIGANDSASVVAKKMEAFEDKMKQMAEKHPGLVQRSNEAPDIPYKVVEKGQLNEHQVLVKQNGKSYIITVNGSPRAAQAANGLTNPDTDLTGAVGKVFEGAEALNRQLSSLYTTLNPDFIGSNYVRDALYSNTMVYVKEGAKYGGSFNLNFAKYNPAEMANLYARYNKGSLDTSNETHRLFLEFMQNGGETGFVNLKQIEKRKSEIAKAIKRDGEISAAQIWGGLNDAIDFANRAVENSARFAAYVTSRKSGRSVGRSVYDAKEISVNFNRKGSGSKFMGAEGQTKAGNAAAFVSGAGRGLYIFWNAGLQGLTNFSRQIGRHPGRALTLASLLFGFGALMSYLGNRDDDDENNYFNLPKYIRRSNVCYKIGDLFVTIPLPVEYRAFYGLGELASSTLAGKEDGTTKDIAKEAVSQVSQLFPIDFVEGGGGLHALIPSAVKPIVEAETNTAWTGLPIYKDNDFNKNMPEYTKVYKTANGYLVEIARALNDATGGNKYKKGFIDINPAKMEYVLKGMLGGAFSFPDKLVKTTETIMGDREFDWRNTPFANRFVKNADERTEYKSLNEQYFKLKDEMDVVKQQLKGFEKEADAGNEKYEKALHQLEDSKDYERLELFKDYEKELKGLNDELKELRMSPDYDKAEEKELQKEIAELQRQLIDEMREIKK